VGLYTVILAAGLGTRMKSSTSKVLHTINGKPIISYVFEAARALKPLQIVSLIARKATAYRKHSGRESYICSPEGTQRYCRRAENCFQETCGIENWQRNGPDPERRYASGKPADLQHWLQSISQEESLRSSLYRGGDHAYGRIVRDGDNLTSIVEDKDATRNRKQFLKSTVASMLWSLRYSLFLERST